MRRLLKATVFYGLGDILTIAVGGFLLIPLYTRTLSQEDFGFYVIVKANSDIFTYLFFLGLPSAISRLYFEHKKTNQHVEYLSSVVTFFLLWLIVFTLGLALEGVGIWKILSPDVPHNPYLYFSVVIASIGFFGAIGSMWLRVENRSGEFLLLQICASIILFSAAFISLAIFRYGLPGLLSSMIISSTFTGLALPYLFKGRFHLKIQWKYIFESLHYGIPVMIGYIAYFLLNRIGIIIIQRFLPVDQIAIFGLAQQLAMILIIASNSFGKAFQPAIFSANKAEADLLIMNIVSLLMLLMACITAPLILFSTDIIHIMAPNGYAKANGVFLIMLVANFTYSLSLISDTILLYNKMPKSSVTIAIIGAILSTLLSLWLIPLYKLIGAALAIGGTYFLITLLNYWVAKNLIPKPYLMRIVVYASGMAILAIFSSWIGSQSYDESLILIVKSIISISIVLTIIRFLFKKYSLMYASND